MYHRLDLIHQKVDSLEGLSKMSDRGFIYINLQRNNLRDFEYFGTHPYLNTLEMQYNPLQSFRGLTKQKMLRVLRLQGTPIAGHPYYRIMALLVIGTGLEEIDSLSVTKEERRIAKTLGGAAALAVCYGWLLDMKERSLEEYEAICREYQRLRRASHEHMMSAQRVTVSSVLQSIEQQRQQCSDSTSPELHSKLTQSRKTITNLVRRVSHLEAQLSSRGQYDDAVVVQDGEVMNMVPADIATVGTHSSFSMSDFSNLDTVSFTRGIQMQHNLSGQERNMERVCLELQRGSLTIKKFLSHQCLIQLPLNFPQIRHMKPSTLVLEDSNGAAVELIFETLPLMFAVYKALYLCTGKSVPTLSTISEGDLITAPQKTVTSVVAELRDSSAADTTPGVTLQLPARDSDTTTVKQSSQETFIAACKTPVRDVVDVLDNVPDVPPLPPLSKRNESVESIAFAEQSSLSFQKSSCREMSTHNDRVGVDRGASPTFHLTPAVSDIVFEVEKSSPSPSPLTNDHFSKLIIHSTSSDAASVHSNSPISSMHANEKRDAKTNALRIADESGVPLPHRPPRIPSQKTSSLESLRTSATGTTDRTGPKIPVVPRRRASFSTATDKLSDAPAALSRKPSTFIGLANTDPQLSMTGLSSKNTLTSAVKENSGTHTFEEPSHQSTVVPEFAARSHIPSRFAALMVESDSD